MTRVRPEISLLGSVRLVIDGAVVDRLPTQRLAALLGFLVLHPGWQPREKIAEAIWPGLPEGKALASLRNALSVLRRVLEPAGPTSASVIESTKTQARLINGLCECDVWAFESAIARQDYALASGLYKGELLPDLHDEWLGPDRERLRGAFVQAVSREARRFLEAGEFQQAISLAERWRDSDPYEPEAVRVFVLALAGSGRSQAAISSLEQFVEETRHELGNAPDLDLSDTRREIESIKEAGGAIAGKVISPAEVGTRNEPTPKQNDGRRLPVYLSRFFGREDELCEIEEWGEGPAQLLTIVGMGGIGKTRLAIEAGRSFAARGKQVVFLSLAGVDSEAAILTAIMDGLELRESDILASIQVIKNYLSGLEEGAFLILDNLEQIVSPAAALVMDLLPCNERLKLICTSRELLGIEGEQLLTLSALHTLGDREAEGATLAQVMHRAVSVQMFVDRARNSRADFALTSRNYRDVVALCRELDGLPLAIEIMAGWSGAWSVEEMRANVKNNRVVARKRDHDPRHRSLEACIDWSFHMLADDAKQLLCVLSLFRAGWTLEGAQAVTQTEDAHVILASLVDRSLVSTTETDTGLRFFMPESIREFCRLRLSDVHLREAAPRFLDFFTRLASRLANQSAGADEPENHRKLDRERENVEAAVSLCEQKLAPVEKGLELAGKLYLHWVYRGQARTGIAIIRRLLAVAANQSGGYGRILALQGLSVLSQAVGDLEAAEQALESLLAESEGHEDKEVRFRVLTQIGNFHNGQGRFEVAAALYEQALAVGLSQSMPAMLAAGHCNLGEALFCLGRRDEAREHLRKSTQFDEQSGNLAGEATLYLGFAESLDGDLASGARRIRSYLQKTSELEFRRGFALSTHFAALVAVKRGEVDVARDLAAGARSYLSNESQSYDALENKCVGIIEQAIFEADPSTALTAGRSWSMREAIVAADRILERACDDASKLIGG